MECTVLLSPFPSARQQNCTAGSLVQISTNVFTIVGQKVQSRNPNSYYQLEPTMGSITIHKSQTVFSSAVGSNTWKKINRTENLNNNGVKKTAKMVNSCT